MMYKTHLAFGFLFGLFAISIFRPSNQILFLFFAIIASAIPDIDHKESKLGKKVKLISYFFKHRGFFHSIFATVLFAAIFFFLFKYLMNIAIAETIAIAILVGYISHLVSDCISKEGIAPLNPFINKFRIRGIIKTGGALELVVFFLVLAIGFWRMFGL